MIDTTTIDQNGLTTIDLNTLTAIEVTKTIDPNEISAIEAVRLAMANNLIIIERGAEMRFCPRGQIPDGWHCVGMVDKSLINLGGDQAVCW